MRIVRGFLLVLTLTLLALPVLAAENYYVKITGARQGAFKGDVVREGSPWIRVISVQNVESPRDVATGQASGKRQWKSVVIRKNIDGSSQQLLRSVESKEPLKQVVIQFVRTANTGKEEAYQTITLVDAQISNFKKVAGPGSKREEEEEITFTYQKIEITDIKGKKMATDDWVSKQ